MKKTTILMSAIILFAFTTHAQTQKNWYIIGGNLSNIGLDFQENNTAFSFNITPRVAWFVKDNLAVGAEVLAGVNTSSGFTSVTYGIGPIARYYVSQKDLTLGRARFFLDANVGIYGTNIKTTGIPSSTTNGLGIGIGPGLAYFLNENIALETLLKYNSNVGFGNSITRNSLVLGIGFQIHLPRAKLKSLKNEIEKM